MENEITLCERCGASLQSVFYFDDKPYGCKCILIVTGLRALPEFGQSVEDAFARQAARDKENTQLRESIAEQDKKRTARIQALQPVIAKLCPVTGIFGNFESDMREALCRGEVLTEKQARIICKIIKDQSVFNFLIGE